MGELIANNLSELISIVDGIYPMGDYLLWYRGHLDKTWELIPSIKRNKKFSDNEIKMNCDFYMKASVALKEKPDHLYYPGWISIMQHYGLPTRLLDWTRSLFVASFFATYNYEEYKNVDGCIWLFRPGQLNEIEGIGKIIPSMDSDVINRLIKGAFPQVGNKQSTDKIYACYPVENNMRVYVQQSAFTVHDSDRKLEEIKSENLLFKIIIPYEAKASFIRELKICGITIKNIYPDAEHIAIELKKYYGEEKK